MGSTNCVIMLKTLNLYDYIQENYFPRLYFKKNVCLFKMLVNGDGCGISLMKWLQLGHDLENSWIMFDHVKCVQSWTTMACHVYNLVYCKVMMIVIYDMQSRDTKVQCKLRRKLVALKKGITNLNFKGFMANSVQVNWNAIWIIYGTRDLVVKIVDNEQTCFFHWIQSLDRHTKQLIAPKFQNMHNAFC